MWIQDCNFTYVIIMWLYTHTLGDFTNKSNEVIMSWKAKYCNAFFNLLNNPMW